MLIQTGDYQAAAHWGERAAATPGAHYLIAMIAVAANSLAGRYDSATRWGQEALRRKPDATRAHFFTAFPIRDSNSRAQIGIHLQKYGF
jgi:hypothetical protein